MHISSVNKDHYNFRKFVLIKKDVC